MTERISENRAEHRYEIAIDDEVVGFAEYRDSENVRDIFHTEVFEGWEGRGLGSKVLQGALDDIRARGLRLTATCPMLARHLEKHPEEKDLLAETTDPAEHRS